MQAYAILKRKFDLDSITVHYNPTSPWQPDPEIRAKSDALWEQKLQKYKEQGIPAWDGDFYRLDNLEQVKNLRPDEPIHLEMSVIKYRYVNTIRDFMDYYDTHPEAWTNYLSVAAMIKTVDNYWVLGLRGKSVHSQKYDMIGGGMHRNELEINNGADIYRNLLKEFREEAGILPEMVANATGVGLIHSTVSNVLLIAKVELNKTKEELIQIFENRLEDEMQSLVFVKEKDLAEYIQNMPGYAVVIPELLNG
jgi:hypothetical protein